jgi:aryl-alcohol dehydrogenase-like predicted oxidoreductase
MNQKERSQVTRRDFLKTSAAGTAWAVASAGVTLRADEKPPVPTRPLGKTGVTVPIIGVGTAPAGHRSRKEAAAFFAQCLDRGVHYLDTAPEFTGYGLAQAAVGDVLKTRRDEAFVVTKCFEPEGEKALALLKQNLDELQTDHVDLVYAHSLGSDKMDPKVMMGAGGVLKALEKARRDGLARFIGISGHNRPGRFLEVIRNFEVQVMMNAVNFVARHLYNFEETVWPEAHERGVALVAMKVFGGMGSKDPKGGRIQGDDVAQAFRYAQSLPNIATVVLGMHDRDELEQNIQWANTYKPLSDVEMRALLERGEKLAVDWGHVYGPAV